MELPEEEETKSLYKWSRSNDQDGCHGYKSFRNILPRTRRNFALGNEALPMLYKS